jgi:hypothetical protein
VWVDDEEAPGQLVELRDLLRLLVQETGMAGRAVA